MSMPTRWTVLAAGALFALSGFISFVTVAAHFWIALVLGGIVFALGLAAMRTTRWGGALVALAGLWMLASSFLGGVQTGPGHLWLNLLTGLGVVALALFLHEPETTRA